jgi:hypothetical protein
MSGERAREPAREGAGEGGSRRGSRRVDITHKYIGVLMGLLVTPVLKTNIFLYL